VFAVNIVYSVQHVKAQYLRWVNS